MTEFRTMAVAPFPIKCLRDKSWITMQTDDLLDLAHTFVRELLSMTDRRLFAYSEGEVCFMQCEELIIGRDAEVRVRTKCRCI